MNNKIRYNLLHINIINFFKKNFISKYILFDYIGGKQKGNIKLVWSSRMELDRKTMIDSKDSWVN